MNYLTAKESRVEKAWNKRGLAGLRTELLLKVGERIFHNWSDEDFVFYIATCVFRELPTREWSAAEQLVRETCGLAGVDIDSEDWSTLLMRVRLSEETLREDLGDE